MKSKHKPVLLQQSIEQLNISTGGVYVDATLGGGGHARQILSGMTSGTLLALDQDPEATDRFIHFLKSSGFEQNGTTFLNSEVSVHVIKDNFRNLSQILNELNLKPNGILADLGMSTDQLHSDKGFSFKGDAPLDMRMSPDLQVTAADLLNALYKQELEQLFTNYADIDYANRLANAVIKFRNQQQIKTVADLREIIATVVPQGNRSSKARQPEVRVFQALRIAVNDEYAALKDFLVQAFELLETDGVLALISFHSGEDRIVKQFMKDKGISGIMLHPTEEEVAANPQSRSAKLRVIRKLTAHETKTNNNNN